MKHIQIAYWNCTQYKDLPYKHCEEMPYSLEKRNEIIDNVLDHGYNVALIKHDDYLIIFINKVMFTQS